MLSSIVFARRAMPSVRLAAVRSLSSECEPAEKLRTAFHAYREENFTRCIPMRFKREFMKAVPTNENGRVHVDSLNSILVNIGRTDQLLSESELQTLLEAADTGNMKDRTIASQTVLELVV